MRKLIIKEIRDKYSNLSEEKKNKKREYGKKKDTIICLKKKTNRLKEYQKNYCVVKKSQYNNQ